MDLKFFPPVAHSLDLQGDTMVVKLENDEINHPQHYVSDTGLESIDVIEAFKLDFCLGNCIKYILRAGKKPGTSFLVDLKKARWYLERRIQEYEKIENMQKQAKERVTEPPPEFRHKVPE